MSENYPKTPPAARIRCPLCSKEPSDKTLVIWETGQAHCYRCYEGENDTSWRRIKAALGCGYRPPPRLASDLPTGQRWSDMAEKIWNRSEPLRGTLSESYLMTRACELPPVDADLRHLRGDDRYPWPSLLGRVTDAITGEPLSLHFTRHDGRGKAPVERPKTLLRGHVKKDGVIRLWPDEAVTGGLCIAEGIETALTAAHAFTPVWGCVDAGNLAEFPVLEGIECLTIVADHDAAGIKSAEACAVRWARAHCEISVVLPETAGRDLNDEVAA